MSDKKLTIFKKSILVPLFVSAIAIVIFLIVSSKMASVLVFIPAVIVAFIIHVNFFKKNSPGPERTLPLYLLLLGIQFIHFTEEYLFDFTVRLPALFGQEGYPLSYWVTFNMIAYFIFLLGGIILFKRIKEFLVIPIFFILAGVILNSIGHILLAIYVGDYFPGLYTALIYAGLGPVLIKRVVDERKLARF